MEPRRARARHVLTAAACGVALAALAVIALVGSAPGHRQARLSVPVTTPAVQGGTPFRPDLDGIGGGRPLPVTVNPSAVAAAVAAGTSGIEPRLVPAYIPAGMTAAVTAVPGGLTIEYGDAANARRIMFGVIAANPPPGGVNASYALIPFRAGRAAYRVYDTTAPLSPRSLMWIEPGTWVGAPAKPGGVEYFAGATGITEAEFFKVLGSLAKV